MSHLFSRFALLSGNFITGIAVLAPAGMLSELSQGLNVSIRDAGLLVTYGAVMLCFASPIVSWLTTRIGRRMLLAGTLAFVGVGHVASAFADSYAALLACRIAILGVAAIYTPQAASTISLIVPEKLRAGAIAFVFLGWSLAIAVGLPIITALATHFGWRETYAVIGLAALAAAILNAIALPNGLRGHPLSLHSFATIVKDKTLLLILLITLFQMSGQFAVTVYMGPVSSQLANAGPGALGTLFSLLGAAGLIGNVLATNIVARAGVQRTLGAFMIVMATGGLIWALGGGVLFVMAAGVFVMGLGITAANSMQQARLVMAAPLLASATVALNTSVLYVGQAIGSATAGFLFANEFYRAIGFVAVGFFLCAFVTFLLTRQPSRQHQ